MGVGKMSDRAARPSRAPRPQKEASALKTWYLVAYNSVCAVLWATVLGYAVAVPLYKGFPFVYLVANGFVRWTQTVAILEIFHSIFGEQSTALGPQRLNFFFFVLGLDEWLTGAFLLAGIVRSPLLTTLMQVWSRIALVWGAVYLFPSVAMSPVYTTLLLAWSITETVRYTYFALILSTGRVPRFLVWLRYSMFYVLYPMGVGSEMLFMWFAARGPAKGTAWEIPLYLLLAQYPIGEFRWSVRACSGTGGHGTLTGFPL
jgi:very-long-chain (3R)-3-hydroxyacyl-CoA dehydratase